MDVDVSDVILDNEPFDIMEMERRPRSRTWPILPPPSIETIHEQDDCDSGLLSAAASGTELNQIGGGEDGEDKSNAGADPSPHRKQNSRKNAWGNFSYADLITQAIQSAPDQRLTLSAIYDWMVQNIAYFKDKGDSTSSAGWKNSIRHNLSLHSRFMRVQNDNNGKSSYWVINPDAKPGKSSRRRSGSVDGAPKEKATKRSRSKKHAQSVDDITSLSPGSLQHLEGNARQNHSCTDLTYTGSPCSSTDSLTGGDQDFCGGAHSGGGTDSLYPLSLVGEQFTRPRSSSNVSTQSSVAGDRLTPIQSTLDLDDDYMQRIAGLGSEVIVSEQERYMHCVATASIKSEPMDEQSPLNCGGGGGGGLCASPAENMRLNSMARAAAEMADVEGMHLNNLAIGIPRVQHDTINLDDSMKLMSPSEAHQFNGQTAAPATNFSELMVRRTHSDSFGSGDSGYESPAAYFSPPQPQASQIPAVVPQPPQMTPSPNSGCAAPSKPPPPYASHLQPQMQPPQRQLSNGGSMPPNQQPQNYYAASPPQLSPNPPPPVSTQMNGSYPMNCHTPPMQRLQHMPMNKVTFADQQQQQQQQQGYPPNIIGPYANTQQNRMVTQQKNQRVAHAHYGTNGSMMSQKMNAMSNMNAIAAAASQGMMQPPLNRVGGYSGSLGGGGGGGGYPVVSSMDIKMEQDFPSDLHTLELNAFCDQQQLACDLDAIIKKDLSEGSNLETIFEPSHVNCYNNNNNNTIINNNTIVNNTVSAHGPVSSQFMSMHQPSQMQMQYVQGRGWVR